MSRVRLPLPSVPKVCVGAAYMTVCWPGYIIWPVAAAVAAGTVAEAEEDVMMAVDWETTVGLIVLWLTSEMELESPVVGVLLLPPPCWLED